jgi:hypothetical protein
VAVGLGGGTGLPCEGDAGRGELEAAVEGVAERPAHPLNEIAITTTTAQPIEPGQMLHPEWIASLMIPPRRASWTTAWDALPEHIVTKPSEFAAGRLSFPPRPFVSDT